MMVSSGNRLYDLGKWSFMEAQADGSVEIHIPGVSYVFRLPSSDEVEMNILADTLSRWASARHWTSAKGWGVFTAEDFVKAYENELARQAEKLAKIRRGEL